MNEPTADIDVDIIARDGDAVTYRNRVTGKRWTAEGVCDYRGDCCIGAVVEISGEQITIRDKEHLREVCRMLGRDRLDELDNPIGIGYDNNCCPFEIEVL